MLLPPTGGPPPERATVRLQSKRGSPLGQLRRNTAVMRLEHGWDGRKGSTGVYSCTSTLRLPPNAREQHKPPSKGSRWFSLAPSQRKASPLAQAKVLSFSTQPERGPRKSAPRASSRTGVQRKDLSPSLSLDLSAEPPAEFEAKN